MKPLHQLTAGTAKAAEMAGVPRHTLLNHYRRHGHWRGVAPRKGTAGRLHWPTLALMVAAGKVPAPRGTPIDCLRDHFIAVSGCDPLAAHQIATALLAEDVCRPTEGEGCAAAGRAESALLADLSALLAVLRAGASRTRHAISRLEGAESPELWGKLNQAAGMFRTEVEHLCRPMTWVRAKLKEVRNA